MERVVISGIGFVHSFGVGSTLDDFHPETAAKPVDRALGGKHRMRHFDLPELSTHPFHPDKKQLRYMRPDSVYAAIAGALALKDAGLLEADHTDTALYTGAGPCYSDMWPALQQGILYSTNAAGSFDLARFGEIGRLKINPFFSIRSLPALPMAALAEKFGIQGENSVWGSFGAESADAVAAGVSDIQGNRAKVALVGGLDFLGHPHKIESIYINDFFEDDLTAASGACFVVLESASHNHRRGGKEIGEVKGVRTISREVAPENKIDYRDVPIFSRLFAQKEIAQVDRVFVQPSGTLRNLAAEMDAARAVFVGAEVTSNATTCETLLAAAEPFGAAIAALKLSAGESAVSLSRSLLGVESGILIERGAPRD